MTHDEIRKEAEKHVNMQWPTRVGAQYSQRDDEIDRFIAGALWGARRMNEEAVQVCADQETRHERNNKLDSAATAFASARYIRALMPAEDEK